ncbi:PaaI family thioesterase [Methanobacterium alcaliphilum]|uniref:PaaI family thioesterase n=1 Tax=Methanobacterium alcaliphilum TaxID=392018 RepID=UPI00200B6F67|nr:PaaI family thioesterase [Methanobacterium alcaliphilum]MCK9150400.1 PaaI family thioesterase [Methanobacterium alcaliphilum]
MEHIKQFFKKDKFAEYNNIQLIEVQRGYAKAKMPITENHLNGIGTVHGGAIFTLADLTFAAAANSHEYVSVAIHADISFMTAAINGTLFAEAKEISRNPKLGTYTIEITDNKGKLIAIFQGMAYVKREKIDFSN